MCSDGPEGPEEFTRGGRGPERLPLQLPSPGGAKEIRGLAQHCLENAAPSPGGFHLTALRNGWTIGRFRAMEELGFPHAVTTRQGLDVNLVHRDHSAVGTLLAEALGLCGTAFCEQVHGSTVLTVERAGAAGRADGLVTRAASLGLWGRGADCPLILAAEPGGIVGMAHASWRGTVKRIAEEFVAKLVALGARPQAIVACISPSAGPCCYEVGQEVLDAAVAGIGQDAERFFRPVGGGKHLMDLWAANADQLVRAGLRPMNVHVAGKCTMCRNDLFPSHRKEGSRAGRFAAIIARR